MKVIVCLDDTLGLCLNGRRLSQDRAIIRDICKDIAESGERLFISRHSVPVFRGNGARAVVLPDPLAAASECDGTCFIEFDPLDRYFEKIDRVTVYRWNRVYPSDLKIACDPALEFPNVTVTEFPGDSHDIITKEVRYK